MFCLVWFGFFSFYALVYFWCSTTLYFQISDDNIFPVSKAVLLPVPFVHFPMPLFWDLAVSLVFCLPESCTLFPLSLSFLYPNVQRSSFKKNHKIHTHSYSLDTTPCWFAFDFSSFTIDFSNKWYRTVACSWDSLAFPCLWRHLAKSGSMVAATVGDATGI